MPWFWVTSSNIKCSIHELFDGYVCEHNEDVTVDETHLYLTRLNLRTVSSRNRSGSESTAGSAMLSPLRSRSRAEKVKSLVSVHVKDILRSLFCHKSFGEASSHIKINVVTETHSDQQSTIDKPPVCISFHQPFVRRSWYQQVPKSNCVSYLPFETRIDHPYNTETSISFQEV